ncbi:hypothetical protein BDZ97DRAFT_1918612 [Flammula alnicola]|nr:hypothetical protein BDZ97DRAFT_1918612 [Flammula alnicola]
MATMIMAMMMMNAPLCGCAGRCFAPWVANGCVYRAGDGAGDMDMLVGDRDLPFQCVRFCINPNTELQRQDPPYARPSTSASLKAQQLKAHPTLRSSDPPGSGTGYDANESLKVQCQSSAGGAEHECESVEFESGMRGGSGGIVGGCTVDGVEILDGNGGPLWKVYTA